MIGDITKVSSGVQLSDSDNQRVLHPVPALNNLGIHQQPSYLPHTEHTTSGLGVGIGIDSFTPRRLDKISTTAPVIHKSAPNVSAPNTFSHSHHTSGNPKIHPNYHPGTLGSHSNQQPTMGIHSGMPGFSKTKLSTTQRRNPVSAPTTASNRQFQSQPRPSTSPTSASTVPVSTVP